MDMDIITHFSSALWVIAADVMAFGLSFLPAKHNSGLPRLGKDPGRLKLGIWTARVDFLTRGRKMIYETYQRVSSTSIIVHSDLQCWYNVEQERQLCRPDLVGRSDCTWSKIST